MRHRTALTALVSVFIASSLHAQAPAGEATAAGAAPATALARPGAAVGGPGGYVVVWDADGSDGDAQGIVARRFDPAGAPTGAEFQVNSFTSGRQSRPAVAADLAGNLVVVWNSAGSDGDGDGIVGRVFDPGGAPASGEFQVNAFTPGIQDNPSVSFDVAGNFVVAWDSDGRDGADKGIAARRFALSGAPLGDEVVVNLVTAGVQERPSVASDVAGNFVVVWQSAGADGDGFGVRGRVFNPAAAPLGDEFAVNLTTAADQTLATVAAADAGGFLVAWDSLNQDGAGRGVFARRFDASGVGLGAEIPLATQTAGDQTAPAAASDGAGDVVVVWETTGVGVFGRRVGPDGVPIGEPFEVSPGGLRAPAVGSAPAGRFVVVWQNGAVVMARPYQR